MSSQVSVVVISKDEAGLRATLEGLQHQTMSHAADVVVVDASARRLDQIRVDHPEVRWIDFPPVPGRITIAEQRNVGVRSTQTPVVAFIDAACHPALDWLERLVDPLLTGDESVTAGRTGSTASTVYASLAEQPEYLEEAATINLAFTRQVFDQVGGFDESFAYGSDIDFTWRLRDAGIRIKFVPDAELNHEWGDGRRQLKRAFRYGQGRARLYLKHPHHRRHAASTDPIVIAYPLFLLSLPLTLWRPLRWLPALLLVPLYRARSHRPLSTVADHLAYGLGALSLAAERARERGRER